MWAVPVRGRHLLVLLLLSVVSNLLMLVGRPTSANWKPHSAKARPEGGDPELVPPTSRNCEETVATDLRCCASDLSRFSPVVGWRIATIATLTFALTGRDRGPVRTGWTTIWHRRPLTSPEPKEKSSRHRTGAARLGEDRVQSGPADPQEPGPWLLWISWTRL